MAEQRTKAESAVIMVQAVVALVLIIALGFHLAEPGVVGLLIIGVLVPTLGLIRLGDGSLQIYAMMPAGLRVR